MFSRRKVIPYSEFIEHLRKDHKLLFWDSPQLFNALQVSRIHKSLSKDQFERWLNNELLEEKLKPWILQYGDRQRVRLEIETRIGRKVDNLAQACFDYGLVDVAECMVNGGIKRERFKGSMAESGVKGHMPQMKVAHLFGEDPNNGKNGYLILSAAASGFLDQCQWLIDHGANVNLTHNGYSALVFAAQSGHHETARLLVGAGALVNHVNNKGFSPLAMAVEGGYFDICELLLTNGADVNFIDLHGRTGLHAAAQAGHLHVCQLLIQHNANVNPETETTSSPLYLAAEYNNILICKLLLQSGALVDKQSTITNRRTPLHVAAKNGHYEVCELLIEHGANVNARDQGGITPIFAAVTMGHEDVCRLLVEKGANVKNHVQDISLVQIAVRKGLYDTLELFLKHGAPVDQSNPDDVTPLFVAIKEGDVEMSDLLLKYGASVNKADKDGMTPLLMCAVKGDMEMVKYLIEKEADLHYCIGSENALSMASRLGHRNLVHYLFSCGARLPNKP
ncbi:ankyrin repeat-containing domain protein [Gorgonomyces haynaldii]|nr:ankyrin repeat-containing domain protein [Gorgonomyces haynaldii]